MQIGTYVSIITLNVNRLNAPTKRYRLNQYKIKTHIFMLPTGDPLQTQRHIQTESKRMEKDIPCEWKPKEIRSGNSYFRQKQTLKNIIRDKEGYYIMIKGLLQEDITIVNIYAPNIGAPWYIRQTLTGIRGEIDSNTIIVGDFDTAFTPMDRSSRQRINKEAQTLNETLDQMDIIDIFSTFHPNA